MRASIAIWTAISCMRRSITAQAKVFVMERAVSFILATSKLFTVKIFPPFELPLSSQFRSVQMTDLFTLDALKIAFAETKNPGFLKNYRKLQSTTLTAVSTKAQNEVRS